jgi:mannose-6-phosphate isomerase
MMDDDQQGLADAGGEDVEGGLARVALRRAYVDHVRSIILPFWLQRGFDRARGAFVERLDFQGADLSQVPRRAMVQARQIFVFADAARVLSLNGAGEVAEEAIENLLKRYLDEGDPSRGFAFSADAKGRQTSVVRDSYTHAFILFAFAAVFRLTGKRRYLDLAETTQDFVERYLIDPVYGGLLNCLPNQDRGKRQNPVMHLLEAYLALHEATRSELWLQKAASIVELFSTTLISTRYRALPERFNSNWTLPEDISTVVFEPGHHFEWVWLLGWFDALAIDDHSALANLLWRTACDHGLSQARLCFDEVRLDYQPAKMSTRLWPHTEGIKAANYRAAAGDNSAIEIASDMYRSLRGGFLDQPFPGGWIDHRDSNGAAMVDYIPASSLYHIYCASTVSEWS